MKLLNIFTLLFSTFMATSISGYAQDHDQHAKQIFQTSVQIKPGEVVYIRGGQHTVPFMEALAAEATRHGGQVFMQLLTDKSLRVSYFDTSEDYLKQANKVEPRLLQACDIFIQLPSRENTKNVYDGVSNERMAIIAKKHETTQEFVIAAKVRGLFIDYPSKEDYTSQQISFTTISDMHQKALAADYKAIQARADALKKALASAKKVRITTPGGTDLSFALGNRPVFGDDGILSEEDASSSFFAERIIYLPGGKVYGSALETSAQGRLVIPHYGFRYQLFENVAVDFKNGKAEIRNADPVKQSLTASGDEAMQFGGFSIGLNPNMKPLAEGLGYKPSIAEGLIYISLGNNILWGGNNKIRGGTSFPIEGATVEVDGKVILKDGKFTN